MSRETQDPEYYISLDINFYIVHYNMKCICSTQTPWTSNIKMFQKLCNHSILHSRHVILCLDFFFLFVINSLSSILHKYQYIVAPFFLYSRFHSLYKFRARKYRDGLLRIRTKTKCCTELNLSIPENLHIQKHETAKNHWPNNIRKEVWLLL